MIGPAVQCGGKNTARFEHPRRGPTPLPRARGNNTAPGEQIDPRLSVVRLPLIPLNLGLIIWTCRVERMRRLAGLCLLCVALCHALPATKPTCLALALSGGGDKGAYEAGVISGLVNSGTDVKWDVVTGISAGSIIAAASGLYAVVCCACLHQLKVRSPARLRVTRLRWPNSWSTPR